MAIAVAPPFSSYVRLAGGDVPQVMWEGEWREIGGPHVDGAVATVICGQLGYRKGWIIYKGGGVYARDYICSGTELGLATCTFVDVPWTDRGTMACTDPVGELPSLPNWPAQGRAAAVPKT